MKENLKKLAKYYKPYLGTFILDMILAMMSAAVALVIPLQTYPCRRNHGFRKED